MKCNITIVIVSSGLSVVFHRKLDLSVVSLNFKKKNKIGPA